MLSLSPIRRGLEGLLSKWSIERKEKVGGNSDRDCAREPGASQNLRRIINSPVFADYRIRETLWPVD